MSKNKIAILSVIAVITVTGVGLLGISQVSAETIDGAYSKIVQNIADKFNLDPEEVQQVFKETREEAFSDRLDKEVEDGNITEAQKQLIIDKISEHKVAIEEINNLSLTFSERQEKMEALREEIKTWADENDIPLRLLIGGGKMERGDGMGRMMEMREE